MRQGETDRIPGQPTRKKAAAWAKGAGISVAEIPAFVNRQTSLILRSDTRVTNHGGENGSVTRLCLCPAEWHCRVVGQQSTVPCEVLLKESVDRSGTNNSGGTAEQRGQDGILGRSPSSEQNVTVINDFTVVNIYTNEPVRPPDRYRRWLRRTLQLPHDSDSNSGTNDAEPTPTPSIVG